MKGFIEVHESYSNKPIMINVNCISSITSFGDIQIHSIKSVYQVRESYKEIIDKIKQSLEE